MSLRRIANSFNKSKERNRGASNGSAASLSPTTSPNQTPLEPSISLPDPVPPNQYKQAQTAYSNQPTTSSSSSRADGANPTPLKVVAPFAFVGQPPPQEYASQYSSETSKDSDPASVRIKRSLTKLLPGKEEDPRYQYHGQSDSRKAGKKEKNEETGTRKRTGSFRSTGSFLDGSSSANASSSNSGSGSGSGTNKFASWIVEKQSGVAKKMQDVLKGGVSHSGSAQSNGQVSGEFLDDDNSETSSISSAPSFVQTAPDDEVARILADPELPLPPMPQQAPYQIPAVYLPRSHTNLHSLTLASLVFPPSPHPLLWNPNQPAFPRSSNSTSKLPRLPTFRAHLAKTRILDRLEAQDLTAQDNESILPFGRRDVPESGSSVTAPEEGDEGRKINDEPGKSVGLEIWARRQSYLQRARVWQGDRSSIKYEYLASARPLYRNEVKITPGSLALAGLVESRPRSLELSEFGASPLIRQNDLPPLPVLTPNPDAISESMLMDSGVVPLALLPPTITSSSISSPRPLPTVPVPAPVLVPRPSETPAPANPPVNLWEGGDDDEDSPVLPVRPLPPRPLPRPPEATLVQPTAPQVMMGELESAEGPLIVASIGVDNPPVLPPGSTQFLSPPSSAHGHTTVLAHSAIPSSSTITSAPHTPLDALEMESLKRVSIGSFSAILSGPGAFTIDEMDGLDMSGSDPHDIDTRRRSIIGLRKSMNLGTPNKRFSRASRTSQNSSPHVLSPSLRATHLLPSVSETDALKDTLTHTPARSAAGSTERLQRFANSNVSLVTHEPPPVPAEPEELPTSPVTINEPVVSVIGDVDEPRHTEPSRISEEHIDPFFIQKYAIIDRSPAIATVAERRESSSPPILPRSEALHSKDSLSLAMDSHIPMAQRIDTRSPVAKLSKVSPTTSTRSPTGSTFSAEVDPSRPSPPVKVVKLKRSGSQMTNGGNSSPSGTPGVGGKSRAFTDTSRFWPHNARVDENEEMGDMDGDGYTPNQASLPRAQYSASPTVMQFKSISQSSLSRVDNDETHDLKTPLGIATTTTTTTTTASSSNHDLSTYGDESRGASDEGVKGADSLSVAIDVASRLSDTSHLDLTLYNPQRSPETSTTDLPRSSLSSSYYDGSAPTRSVSMDEHEDDVALPSSPQEHDRDGRQARSPERMARIEAHLDSVAKNRAGSQTRPDFLPPPPIASKAVPGGMYRSFASSAARNSVSSDMSYDEIATPTRRPSETQQIQASGNLSDSSTSSRRTSRHQQTLRPPARWSETAWRERQRSLGTLPLPSASIPLSATRRPSNTSTMGGSRMGTLALPREASLAAAPTFNQQQPPSGVVQQGRIGRM